MRKMHTFSTPFQHRPENVFALLEIEIEIEVEQRDTREHHTPEVALCGARLSSPGTVIPGHACRPKPCAGAYIYIYIASASI